MRYWISDRCGTQGQAQGPNCRARGVCLWTLRTKDLTKVCIRSLRPGPDEGRVSKSHRAHSWNRKRTIFTAILSTEQLFWTWGSCTPMGYLKLHQGSSEVYFIGINCQVQINKVYNPWQFEIWNFVKVFVCVHWKGYVNLILIARPRNTWTEKDSDRLL